MLEDRRFVIRLEGMIDLDHGVGGLFGVDGDGNWHLREKRRRRKATGACTTAKERQNL